MMAGPHDPAGRTPEPSYGADEEGDVPLPADGAADDPAAWVHIDDSADEAQRNAASLPGDAGRTDR